MMMMMIKYQETACDKDRSTEDFRIQRHYNRNTVHVEYKNKSDRANRNHLKITQKIPEQHTGKARNQGTTENRHTWHCVHTWGSVRPTAKARVQMFIMGSNKACTKNFNHITAATLYNLQTWFVLGA
jgi:hypothetical protein